MDAFRCLRSLRQSPRMSVSAQRSVATSTIKRLDALREILNRPERAFSLVVSNVAKWSATALNAMWDFPMDRVFRHTRNRCAASVPPSYAHNSIESSRITASRMTSVYRCVHIIIRLESQAIRFRIGCASFRDVIRNGTNAGVSVKIIRTQRNELTGVCARLVKYLMCSRVSSV